MSYFLIFIQSNLLEMPAYLLFMERSQKGSSLMTSFVFITGLNAITHPIVFFLIMNLKLTYLQNILLAEGFAILVETLIINRVMKQKFISSFLTCLLANFLSWQISPLLTYGIHRKL